LREVPLILDSALLWAGSEARAEAEAEEEQEPETKVQAQGFYSWFSKLYLESQWARAPGRDL
jgi:hypothetical protein